MPVASISGSSCVDPRRRHAARPAGPPRGRPRRRFGAHRGRTPAIHRDPRGAARDRGHARPGHGTDHARCQLVSGGDSRGPNRACRRSSSRAHWCPAHPATRQPLRDTSDRSLPRPRTVGRRGPGPFSRWSIPGVCRSRPVQAPRSSMCGLSMPLEARPARGTVNAAKPFWSPDSKSIGFAVPRALKRVSLAGGSPRPSASSTTLADDLAAGGAWNRDDVILFGSRRALYRVPASGGTPEVIVGGPDSPISYRWPQFLPDGRRFWSFRLVCELPVRDWDVRRNTGFIEHDSRVGDGLHGTVFARRASCCTSRMAPLSPNPSTFSLWAPWQPGPRDGADPRQLQGHISQREFFRLRRGQFAYSGGSELRQLVWVDRAGKPAILRRRSRAYFAVELSPNGTYAAAEIIEEQRSR